jgi:hypothetical protein
MTNPATYRDHAINTKKHIMKRKILLLTILIGIFISVAVHGQSKVSSNRYNNIYKQYSGATCPLENDSIKHFVYFARDREAIHNHPFLKIKRFVGAQIMYPWELLEPNKGIYDFSIIREDYKYLLSQKKKLFIQLQDATFRKDYIGIPKYLLTDEFNGGTFPQIAENGDTVGWVAKRWNQKIQNRFALLLKALGNEFDGKVEGINLQESSIEINLKESSKGIYSEADSTFSPERYSESIKINMLSLKKSFPKSTTMQYANFMPGEWLPRNDKGYLRSIYNYGDEIGVGLGGPDLMVQNKGNLNHTVAMMHEKIYAVPLGIAIQDENYIGKTGDLQVNESDTHENIVPLLHAFAKDFLKVKYMFWVDQEPYFSEDVIPCFKPK